jgi:hypothetical protein
MCTGKASNAVLGGVLLHPKEIYIYIQRWRTNDVDQKQLRLSTLFWCATSVATLRFIYC